MLGDCSCKNISIVVKFVDDDNKPQTIGAEYTPKMVKTKRGTVKMKIWDATAQERYRSLVSMYIRAMGILLVYNINEKKSIKNMKEINETILLNREEGSIVTVVAHHVDDSQPRQVPIEEGWEFTNSKRYQYFEVSSETGANIKESFVSLVDPQPIKPLSLFVEKNGA